MVDDRRAPQYLLLHGGRLARMPRGCCLPKAPRLDSPVAGGTLVLLALAFAVTLVLGLARGWERIVHEARHDGASAEIVTDPVLPNRSRYTAHDGRPICATCGRAYWSLRFSIGKQGNLGPRMEDCQTCKAHKRNAARRAKP